MVLLQRYIYIKITAVTLHLQCKYTIIKNKTFIYYDVIFFIWIVTFLLLGVISVVVKPSS